MKRVEPNMAAVYRNLLVEGDLDNVYMCSKDALVYGALSAA